jgi:hypothetical protein
LASTFSAVFGCDLSLIYDSDETVGSLIRAFPMDRMDLWDNCKSWAGWALFTISDRSLAWVRVCMRLGRTLKVWTLLALVAAAALVCATVRFASELRYWTLSHGWNTSVLPVGAQVVPCDEIRIGDSTIRAGTRCVVVGDPTDEDSAYPYRGVVVNISEGQFQGTIVEIQRSLLRVR